MQPAERHVTMRAQHTAVAFIILLGAIVPACGGRSLTSSTTPGASTGTGGKGSDAAAGNAGGDARGDGAQGGAGGGVTRAGGGGGTAGAARCPGPGDTDRPSRAGGRAR